MWFYWDQYVLTFSTLKTLHVGRASQECYQIKDRTQRIRKFKGKEAFCTSLSLFWWTYSVDKLKCLRKLCAEFLKLQTASIFVQVDFWHCVAAAGVSINSYICLFSRWFCSQPTKIKKQTLRCLKVKHWLWHSKSKSVAVNLLYMDLCILRLSICHFT